MWIHLRDEHGRAKTDRECYLCGYVIPAGDVRTRRYGTYRGEFVMLDMHDRCVAVTRGWDDEDWETFEPGNMSEDEIFEAENTEDIS